jgi:hypothetical protein
MQQTPLVRLVGLYVQAQSSNPLIVLETAGLTKRDRALLEALVQHSSADKVAAWKRGVAARRTGGAAVRAFVDAATSPPPSGATSVLALRMTRSS